MSTKRKKITYEGRKRTVEYIEVEEKKTSNVCGENENQPNVSSGKKESKSGK